MTMEKTDRGENLHISNAKAYKQIRSIWNGTITLEQFESFHGTCWNEN